MKRLVISCAAAGALVLAACGGGSDSTSAGTAAPDTTTAAADTTAAGATDTTLAATETTAAAAPAVDPFDFPTGAPIIVDGHVYDVCTLLDPEAVTSLIGEGAMFTPRALKEIAPALGQGPTDLEGAVECLANLPFDPTRNTLPSVSLQVWSDSSVAYALQDPSATAAGRAATMLPVVRAGRSSFDGTPLITNDLPGGGWADHDQFTNSYIGAVGDGVVVQLRVGSPEICDGDAATVQACWQKNVDDATTVGQPILEAAIAALTAGDGPAASEWPTVPAPSTLTYTGSNGPVDACTLAADALNAVAPAAKYQVVDQSTISTTSDTGLPLTAPFCQIDPVDGDVNTAVQLLLPAASPDVDAYIADSRNSTDPSKAPIAGGDDFLATYRGEIWVHKNGNWIGFTTIPANASGFTSYDGSLDPAFAQIVAAL